MTLNYKSDFVCKALVLNICWAQLDKYGNFGAGGKYFKNFETIRASEVKTISIFLKFVNKYDEEFSKRLEITDYDTKDFAFKLVSLQAA